MFVLTVINSIHNWLIFLEKAGMVTLLSISCTELIYNSNSLGNCWFYFNTIKK